jgi:NitT/TauT family transport system substrate-binding protein
MKRNLVFFLICSLIILSLAGCAPTKKEVKQPSQTQEPVSFNVAVLRGPSALSMVKMIDQNPSLGKEVKVNYIMEQSPDVLVSKLLTGEIEMATIPTNMAAKIYNKGVGYQLAVINTWGVMYVVTNGVNVSKWSDLKGQQINTVAKGSAADVVFKYLLTKNNINPEMDAVLSYITTPVEAAQLMIAGKSKIAALPEPWVSVVLSKNPNARLALDLQKEWTRLNGENVPFAQTCLVVKKDFANKNPQIIANFLAEYNNSINWINKNSSQAGELAKKHDIGIPADVTAKAIPMCNIRYMDAISARPAVEKYLQVLLDFSPESIGGKLPDAKFYYQK